ELRLEAAASAVRLDIDVRQIVAQPLHQSQSLRLRPFAGDYDIHIRRICRRFAVLNPQQLHDALLSKRPADCGGRLPSELAYQAVVASARAYRALRAQLTGDPFEHRV